MKNSIRVDEQSKALVITKSFYKKACVFGSKEYYELRKAKAENEGFEVLFGCDIAQKKTYNGLGFKRMEDYINSQPNAEANLAEFEKVKEIAVIKGGAYPLTKQWFLATFPEFKVSEVLAEEIGKKKEAAVVASAVSGENTLAAA